MDNHEFDPETSCQDSGSEAKLQESGKNTARNERHDSLVYLHDLVYILITVLLIALLLFKIIVVSGPSMNSTLADGDVLILLNNTLYHQIKHGDIVVVSKKAFKDGEPIIKRVIATEGQQVDIDFNSGVVYVDGIEIDEPYVNTPTNLDEGTIFPLTVQEGCIFVMGDNRNQSKDSRSMDIGQIDKREVLGKALFRVFPGTDPTDHSRHFDRIVVLS